MGQWLADHHQVIEYFRLIGESSDRASFAMYGHSYERRPLGLLLVSSPGTIERLEEVRADLDRLSDPEATSAEEAQGLAERTPVVVWLNFGNDGNESAAVEAALHVAYFLAASNDSATAEILENVLVVINPCHNPESLQRHVAWYKASYTRPGGGLGDPNPDAQEHGGDWRMDTNYNHYQIDLNRDAFAATQLETREIIEELHVWHPQVFVDFHGQTENYFFTPYALPVNLNYPESTRRWARTIGKANAEAFAQRGWSFFTGEIFDLFYSGYWDSYPALNGAVGMTYETSGGGSKGFAMEREDETVVTLRDGIAQHVTSAFATLGVAATNREALLRDYYDFRASGMEQGRKDGIHGYLLDPGRDPARAGNLANLLGLHGIRVLRSTEETTLRVRPFPAGDETRRSFPPGTFYVPYAQPQHRLLEALFEADPELEQGFLSEVEERRSYNQNLGKKMHRRGLGFYDLTAWSLPLAHGVPTWTAREDPGGPWEVLERYEGEPGGVYGGRATYAYVFDSGPWNAATLLAQLLRRKYRAAVATEPFSLDGGSFGRGSIVLRVPRNPESLHEDIARLSRETGVPVVAVSTALTPAGPDLGSPAFDPVRAPRVCLVTNEPTSPTAFGALWFLFEREVPVPFSAVRADQLEDADLSRFNVVILPHGSASGYERVLGEKGIEKLRGWIERGGTLVAIGGAAAFAAKESVDLASVRPMKQPAENPDEENGAYEAVRTDVIPGAILKVRFDPRHWLAFGLEEEIPCLVYSDRVFLPTEKGENVGVYEEDPRVGGFLFEEAEEYLPGKPYLVHEPLGEGNVVLFVEDPYFRLFWKETARLLLNAVFFAPTP
jgi:hypothetical protein